MQIDKLPVAKIIALNIYLHTVPCFAQSVFKNYFPFHNWTIISYRLQASERNLRCRCWWYIPAFLDLANPPFVRNRALTRSWVNATEIAASDGVYWAILELQILTSPRKGSLWLQQIRLFISEIILDTRLWFFQLLAVICLRACPCLWFRWVAQVFDCSERAYLAG